ncbi:DUF2231 domain-containing protein [Nocardioides sp. 1609]|uniref:DUF2231 domain-containing protein n=1 Tax=Nocardioides sp. 1609 TaxID=2508327 RepID=UPI00106F5990|nr:DUF2231 domain-containing protein [Nocardioides sp. 1609]
MEINGLPLHPLVVHAAVVFGPLAALSALAYLVPAWRDRLRWPTVVLVLLAFVSIWAAFLSGESFRDDPRFDAAAGVFLERLEHHEEVAETLRLVITGFTVVTLAAAFLHERKGPLRILLGVLVAAGAIGTIVYVVMTGDAGSQAVYGQ